MATDAYWRWVNAGRPFRRPPVIRELKDLARAAGVPFLGDLGNEAHLQANTPEDHTPFSATPYPVPLPDYVITALDLGKGAHGDRMLADARAGRLPWLKYMNHRGKNYSRRRGNFMIPASSGDDHFHGSLMSDHTYASIGAYNPFVAGGSVADETVEETDQSYIALTWRVHTLMNNLPAVPDNEQTRKVPGLAGAPNAMYVALQAAAARLELSDADREALVDDIRGEIGDTVESALRRVLGGLDGATPAVAS